MGHWVAIFGENGRIFGKLRCLILCYQKNFVNLQDCIGR